MERFFNYLLCQDWMIDELYAIQQFNEVLFNMSLGHKIEKRNSIISFIDGNNIEVPTTNINSSESNSILVMRLSGAMTVNDQPCSDGIQTLSDNLYKAYSNKNISGILLDVNSGGGESTAGHILKQAISDSNKPVVVHGVTVGSAALLSTLPATEIVANGESAKFGSIGSFVSISKKFLEDYSKNFIDVYASSSPDKNKEIRQLFVGDSALLQKSVDKNAEVFQQEVQKYRNLKYDPAKTLSGGMFEAKDAKKRGLVDSIGTRSYAIQRLRSHIKYIKN